MAAPPRNRALAIVITLVLAVVVGVAGAVVYRTLTHEGSQCTVGGYHLDTSQTAIAATMVGAVTSYRPVLPDRAATLALAAALQESKLQNHGPGQGDRDSVGVLQQRPSQGWGNGDPSNLQDVFKATTEFLQHLVKVDGWQSMPLADAVQKVQISADGSQYAKHEKKATALAQALLGLVPKAVTCHFSKPTQVAAANIVATRLAAQVPVHTPTTSGLVITVPGARWQTVGWFVAYADRLGIDQVSYAAHTWTRAHGWKDSAAPTTQVTATMADLSH